MAHHLSLTEWHRKVALDIAQAYPLAPAVRIRASGNHLASQNDEPEPTTADDSHLAEEAAIAADLARNERKAERARERSDRRAIEEQLVEFQARGWV